MSLSQELLAGLSPESQSLWHGVLTTMLERTRVLYGEVCLSTGERTFDHALSMARMATTLGLDVETRVAALGFALADFIVVDAEALMQMMGLSVESTLLPSAEVIAGLVHNLARLKSLRPLTQAEAQVHVLKNSALKNSTQKNQASSQAEVLRKMLLAMASDIRVVLLRLASRTQSLRYFAATANTDLADNPDRVAMARETLAIYAPLANRLGVWQLKWELEDLAFRFIEPATYKQIARLLDEKRREREVFMARAIADLRSELAKLPELGDQVQVNGRPKHIYSIWNKMRGKGLAFDQLMDVRALRVIVPEVRDCYTVLGIVHQLWQPIRGEFDDYISHPKGNDYRSLHTAVMAVIAGEERSLEVQIRTEDMHRHAELGVAAHWRYKEAGHSAKAEGDYENKISWLRQLLSWREEVADSVATSVDWAAQFKRAALDDTIYVMTPQGRVVDLPKGATPIDFAYRVHTDLGHRCRGAKVNGHMVPLLTPLATGQTVDILTAKTGTPSRDWLNPGYLTTHRARQKVRQWFAAQEAAEQQAQGRSIVQRELQRQGETQASIDTLAVRLGVKSVDALFLAVARGDITPRAISVALRGEAEPAIDAAASLGTAPSRADGRTGKILVVGVDNLLTQMGRCCKPIPPDAIAGFVTRGRGVSVHRLGCRNFHNMAKHNPERVISAEWGAGSQQPSGTIYAVDMLIEAADRHDLLRDISEVLARERVSVTAMKTRVSQGVMYMSLTVELHGAGAVQKVLGLLKDLSGVRHVQRL